MMVWYDFAFGFVCGALAMMFLWSAVLTHLVKTAHELLSAFSKTTKLAHDAIMLALEKGEDK